MAPDRSLSPKEKPEPTAIIATFRMDDGDPGHFTGLTGDQFDDLAEAIYAIGGYDLSVKRQVPDA